MRPIGPSRTQRPKRSRQKLDRERLQHQSFFTINTPNSRFAQPRKEGRIYPSFVAISLMSNSDDPSPTDDTVCRKSLQTANRIGNNIGLSIKSQDGT
jgi:uncharacterized protein with NAD-binding domain and iron-sulfur cluster